jgi:hypothetical protein
VATLADVFEASLLFANSARDALTSYIEWRLGDVVYNALFLCADADAGLSEDDVRSELLLRRFVFQQASWIPDGLATNLFSDTLGMPETIKELVFPKEIQLKGSRFHGTLVARSESLWSDLAYFVLHSAQVLARRWPRLLLSCSKRVTVSSAVWLGRSELSGAVCELADGRVRH